MYGIVRYNVLEYDGITIFFSRYLGFTQYVTEIVPKTSNIQAE